MKVSPDEHQLDPDLKSGWPTLKEWKAQQEKELNGDCKMHNHRDWRYKAEVIKGGLNVALDTANQKSWTIVSLWSVKGDKVTLVRKERIPEP